MKTNKIQKILIAMDYDETSIKVSEAGVNIAEALGAEIILLHVISEQPVYYSSYMNMRELQVDMLGDLKISAQIFLDKAKAHLGIESIKTVLIEGNISANILKTAEEMNIDLIVMGTHSRNWLEGIILGSEAQDVLKSTTIPLYIIPTKEPV